MLYNRYKEAIGFCLEIAKGAAYMKKRLGRILILGCLVHSALFLTGCGGQGEAQAAGNSVEESQDLDEGSTTTTKVVEEESADAVINEMGNTPNNIGNYGKASIQGDWIYYSGNDDKVGGLYKMKTDGTDVRLLRKGEISDINVIGKEIYFVNEGSICKISTSGTEETILKENCGASKLCVVGKWIYYTSNSQNTTISGNTNTNTTTTTPADGLNKIYKVQTTGIGDLIVTSKRDITTNVKEFCVVDGSVIYYTDDAGVCSMKLDGQGVTRIVDKPCSVTNIANGFVYFVSDGKLYSVGLSGGEPKVLSESADIQKINVTDNAIYFVSSAGLSKMGLDGSNQSVVNADWGETINIAGDWIFSQKGIFGYKVKTDGSEYVKFSK